MKAFVLKKQREVAFIEKEIPTIADEHGALLKPVAVSPCTSDVHTILYGSPKRENLTLGHECVAYVLKVGKDVQDFREGDLVAVPAITPDWGSPESEINPAHAGTNFSAHMLGKSIDGVFQEIFYLPYADRNLAHIPPGVSVEQALMCVDVVTTGFTAAEEAGDLHGKTVAVFGIGAIGLSAVAGAFYYGADKVYAVGSRKENMNIAESLGAETINYKTVNVDLPMGMHPLANATNSNVVNYILQETGTKGVDAVLICGGNDQSFSQAIDVVKYGTGVVVNVMYYAAKPGEHENNIDAIQIPKFSIGRGMAGKTIKFMLAKGGRERMEYLLDLCANGIIHPEVFISKIYQGIDNIPYAINDMKERRAIKTEVFF